MFFRPRYTIDTIYHLDPKVLNNMGIKVVFSDLDNTLLAWNKFETAQEMADLHEKLAANGIKLMVLSNNNDERVGKVLNPYGIEFVARARKPFPFVLKEQLTKMGLDKDQVMLVGDQLMTDIIAGNTAGVNSVLVQPLVNTDKWNTRINRFLEKIVFGVLAIKRPVIFTKELIHG